MRLPKTIPLASRRIIWWIVTHTTHRHVVKASWELNVEYEIHDSVQSWIRSAPERHLFWIDHPDYPHWDRKEWMTTYHWAFRNREDAMLHAMRRPE
jgi:hypothetical protein